MKDSFNKWLHDIGPEIDNVGLSLGIQLSGEPEELISDLIKIEALNGRVGELLAKANSFLDLGRFFYLPAKDGQISEGERKMASNKECADIQMVRDVLESYANAIKQRIMLGQSILAYQRSYAEPKGDFMKPVKSFREILEK